LIINVEINRIRLGNEHSNFVVGWDRGYLAPSADFRWSEKALSESYFYSNMSPQLDDFNREGWAELEGLLR
jgi:endonuclease G